MRYKNNPLLISQYNILRNKIFCPHASNMPQIVISSNSEKRKALEALNFQGILLYLPQKVSEDRVLQQNDTPDKVIQTNYDTFSC